MWPSWDQAAVAATVLLLVSLLTRQATGWRRGLSLFTGELSLVAFLYALWQLAAFLPLTHNAGAYRRGQQVDRFEMFLHLPSERWAEHLLLNRPLLAKAGNLFYETVHVPALLLFLLWLFVRHRDKYGHWRNALAVMTGGCLLIRFVRVAPPRLMPRLGFVDLAAKYGQSVYGPVGTGISDQYAAMPSIHVAWAALVSFGIVACSKSRWRYLALLHVTVTMFVVSATANHWWLDGIVSIILLAIGLLADTAGRRFATWLRARRSAAPEPVLEPAAA
ncbi:MAG: phosphatase PAP2 family protein [Actinomycetota bacterium]|nr:phosphatase PAP2 family protein [Actinomycetota bacterium]